MKSEKFNSYTKNSLKILKELSRKVLSESNEITSSAENVKNILFVEDDSNVQYKQSPYYKRYRNIVDNIIISNDEGPANEYFNITYLELV